MSTVTTDGEKTILSRRPEDWRPVFNEFAGEDRLRWKMLACHTLHGQGWTMEMIGRVFGHPKGHVSRLVEQLRGDIQAHFAPAEPEPLRDFAGAA